MERKGKLIILSAPSGTGKTVVTDKLLADTQDIVRSVSVTTRPLRTGEKNGEDYFFTDETRFRSLIDKEKLLEWAMVHGYYYGTPLDYIESETADGRDVILVIDVQGAEQLRDNGTQAHFIFLKPPSMEELRRRLKKRATEDTDEMAGRLLRAREELKSAELYDYIVVNDDLDETVEEIKNILEGIRDENRKSD